MPSEISTIVLYSYNSILLRRFWEKDWISEDYNNSADCKNEKIHMGTSLGFAPLSETHFPPSTLYIFIGLCKCRQSEVSLSSKAMAGTWAQCLVSDSFDKRN